MDNVTRFLMLAREPIIPRIDRPFKVILFHINPSIVSWLTHANPITALHWGLMNYNGVCPSSSQIKWPFINSFLLSIGLNYNESILAGVHLVICLLVFRKYLRVYSVLSSYLSYVLIEFAVLSDMLLPAYLLIFWDFSCHRPVLCSLWRRDQVFYLRHLLFLPYEISILQR